MNTSKTTGAIAVLVLVLLIVGAVYFFGHKSVVSDVKNNTYTINGQAVTLIDGRAESEAAPGSASNVITQYFGNEAVGDVNGDGLPDTVFILTQSTGGSGTFYYVAVALKGAKGYTGTNAVLLGDRIAPQTTEIHAGKIVVNYADRNPGDPMTTAPSVGKSLYLDVSKGALEVDAAAALADMIRVTSPAAKSAVTSPLHIDGEARGSWYFEASFPVSLVDGDGNTIAQGVASAQGDWMTSDFVPFTADLTFNAASLSGAARNATLVLKKDNPSGDPARDASLEVPVILQ